MDNEQPLQILRLDRKGGAVEVEVAVFNAEEAEKEGACWIHLNYTHAAAIKWLQEADGLDPIISRNLVDDDTRPRCFSFHEGIFLSLRGVNLNPAADPEDMIAIRLWVTEHCIVTSNRRHLLSLEDVRQALVDGRGPASSASFLVLLADRLAFRAESIIEQIQEDFDQIEDELAVESGTGQRGALSRIRRQAIRLRRFFAPQREALEHLIAEAPPWLSRSDKAHLRESINKFRRFVEELDSLRDRAVVVQEEILGRLSETLNRRMYALSMVATLFLPLGFLTGLLGANVGGIPGSGSPYGFLAICLGTGALGICMVGYLKVKKWF